MSGTDSDLEIRVSGYRERALSETYCRGPASGCHPCRAKPRSGLAQDRPMSVLDTLRLGKHSCPSTRRRGAQAHSPSVSGRVHSMSASRAGCEDAIRALTAIVRTTHPTTPRRSLPHRGTFKDERCRRAMPASRRQSRRLTMHEVSPLSEGCRGLKGPMSAFGHVKKRTSASGLSRSPRRGSRPRSAHRRRVRRHRTAS